MEDNIIRDSDLMKIIREGRFVTNTGMSGLGDMPENHREINKLLLQTIVFILATKLYVTL